MEKGHFRLVFLDAATFGDVSFERFTSQWDCTFHQTTSSVKIYQRTTPWKKAISDLFF